MTGEAAVAWTATVRTIAQLAIVGLTTYLCVNYSLWWLLLLIMTAVVGENYNYRRT